MFILFLRSGRAGLVTALQLHPALEPPAYSLNSDLIHAPDEGCLCDDWMTGCHDAD
jgi:hypothetical protein